MLGLCFALLHLAYYLTSYLYYVDLNCHALALNWQIYVDEQVCFPEEPHGFVEQGFYGNELILFFPLSGPSLVIVLHQCTELFSLDAFFFFV